MQALIIPIGRAKQLRAGKTGRTGHALINTKGRAKQLKPNQTKPTKPNQNKPNLN